MDMLFRRDPFNHIKRVIRLMPMLILISAIDISLLTACADRSAADDTKESGPTWYTYAVFRTTPEAAAPESASETSTPEAEVLEQSQLTDPDTSEIPSKTIFTAALTITDERPVTVSEPIMTVCPAATTIALTTVIPADTPIISSCTITPPVTVPLISAAPITTQTPSSNSGKLKLISVTSPVGRNQKATVIVSGMPDTLYQISVYYSTTVSTASGLEPKQSDSNGEVSWTWKVGSRTAAGAHKIVITGGGETLEFEFVTLA